MGLGMSIFDSYLYLPRLSGAGFWKALQAIHGQNVESLTEQSFNLQQATFHAAGDQISERELRDWRFDLNIWAREQGFPYEMNAEKKSAWDVELGKRLCEDLKDLPESSHPHVWCWIAVNLLPHFVVHRWGWPSPQDGQETPTGSAKWARFGPDLRNGLRLAAYRIATYGEDLASDASEQEFQSLQNRPSYGRDRRVARVILQTLVDSYADRNSNYGKNGGTRALDCDDICQELQRVNSMRPFCFRTDSEVQKLVSDAIKRLPEYRRPPKASAEAEFVDHENLDESHS